METTTMGYIGVLYIYIWIMEKKMETTIVIKGITSEKSAPLYSLYTPLEKHGPEACKTSHFQGLQVSLERSAGYTEAHGIR